MFSAGAPVMSARMMSPAPRSKAGSTLARPVRKSDGDVQRELLVLAQRQQEIAVVGSGDHAYKGDGELDRSAVWRFLGQPHSQLVQASRIEVLLLDDQREDRIDEVQNRPVQEVVVELLELRGCGV